MLLTKNKWTHSHVLINIGNQYSKYPFGMRRDSRTLLTLPIKLKTCKKLREIHILHTFYKPTVYITAINHIIHAVSKPQKMP